jgi:hypothetical protein
VAPDVSDVDVRWPRGGGSGGGRSQADDFGRTTSGEEPLVSTEIKPLIPTRLFISKSEALAWLRTLLV